MHNLLARIIKIEQEEVGAALWAFAYFFMLMCGYYILRPVRDEMGVQAGIDKLPWLFTATFVAMLAITPLFGWLTARFARTRFLPWVYYFFALNLVAFFFAYRMALPPLMLAKVFFVWVSVFVLFVVSVFWSLMADLFNTEQARRLYGFIAAGGTAGAIAGPLITASLAQHLGAAQLLLISAALLTASVYCIRRLDAWARQRAASRTSTEQTPLGGSIWAGVVAVLRSPYLLAICVYLFCYTVLSTFLYFQQNELVRQTLNDSAQRVALFAKVDLAVNVLTLLLQVVVFGRMIKTLGLTLMLVLMPVVSLVGFSALALWPTLAVLIAFGVLRRAGEYAIAKPTRETLFNVLSREEKYKAKNVIDTVVYRGGDVAAGWGFDALRALGVGFSGIGVIAVPIAVLWTATGWLLGRQHMRRQPSARVVLQSA